MDTRFARSIARPPDSFSRLFLLGALSHGKPTVVERLDPGIDALAASATAEPISRVARGVPGSAKKQTHATDDAAMSPGAVADAGFQVPDTVRGHVGRRDQEIQRATVAERFASRAFADALREKLAFEEREIDAAVEVLLEVAPLLVNKQVVAVEDATVRPLPFRAFRDRSVERETRRDVSRSRPSAVPGPANDPDLPPFPSPSSRENR